MVNFQKYSNSVPRLKLKLNELENKWRKTFILISWVAFCLDLSLDNTKRIKHYIMLPSFTIKRSVPIFFFKLHYGTINCKIVHNISPCNHLDTLICALKWKNLEFVKNPQPSLGCFETKITRASCVRAALQRLNHTCSRTILKGYIIGKNLFWSCNLISMDIHSMAMGNLNKSKETTPTTTTALKEAP